MSVVEAWAIARRRWRWIVAATVLAIIGAVALIRSGTPIYEGAVTLRFEDPEAEMPDVLRRVSAAGQVATEIEELRSRTLVETVARALALRARPVAPKGVSRATLFDEISVAPGFDTAGYRIVPDGDSSFTIEAMGTGVQVASADSGAAVDLGGVAFRLTPAAAAHPEIQLRVSGLAEATEAVRDALTVTRTSRDGNIVQVRYRDTDPDLAWRVPNAIATEFTRRRRDLQQASAASTVVFLRAQLDSVSRELARSEDALRRFRERERAISPQVEAMSRVQRLVELEAERGGIEAERVAFARLVAEVEAAAQRRGPGEPSPFRRLVAFPTLMQHAASTDVLASLSQLETQRRELLTRRTEADPEVQALTARIADLEDELQTTATTYLRGLGDQVAAIDGTLQQFNRELADLPRREVEYARLDRTPKVLEGIYTMLQTRLKEVEISQAAADRTVRVVDPAAAPLAPAKSPRTLLAAALVIAGVMFGFGMAFVRELTDAALHTRADVQLVTGLPVLGLIPRIRGVGGRIATIAKQSAIPARAGAGSAASTPSAAAATTYTFFGAEPPPRPELPTNGNGSHADDVALATVPSQIGAVEAYGILRTNIAFSRPDQPMTTLVMTSALPGDGKTTTAVNLAITLAMRGQRVLLIDADLRKGRVHIAMEAAREPGLSEFLQGTRSWADTLRTVQVDGRRDLHYITCGRPPQSPSGMLESPALLAMLGRLRPEYDAIILDAPPANLVTDAALLAAIADGVLLVARAGVTDAEALGHALNGLRHVGAPVLGVVLNDIDFGRESRYDRAYRFYDTSSYLGASEPSAS